MTTPSLYLKHPISIKDLGLDQDGALSNRWMFVGIDMAPIENLETGVTVIDRDRNLLKMEKLNTDEELGLFLKNLDPPRYLVVALDVPKSLSIDSKWRQQQIKMHPLRLQSEHGEVPTERFAQRAKDFYDEMTRQGFLVLNYFTPHAKMRLDLVQPYRNRTPQGCRAQQALIKEKLGIKDMPTNLAPSSVLDAMIGAYLARMVYAGKESVDYGLYRDNENRVYFDPLKRLEERRIRRVRYSRRRR